MQSSLRALTTLSIITSALFLSSCAIITTPLKVAGKVTTTSVGLVGKAAGAGFDAMSNDDESEQAD